MSYFFSGVNLLTYEHKPVFFDAGLRYKIEKQFTIEGTLYHPSNPSGVSGILNDQQTILSNSADYQPIVLNGISFGQGKINKIEFKAGSLVAEDQYTYDIICYDTGNMGSQTTGVYSGINWATVFQIDSLQEKLEYSQQVDGSQSYVHSVGLRFNKQNSSDDPTSLAKAFASNLFSSVNGLNAFLISYSALGNAKRFYSESYDLINSACAFTETVEIPATRNGDYSVTYGYNIQLGEDGFTTVEETAEIRGVSSAVSLSHSADEGISAIISNAYTRSNSVYQNYNFSSATLYSLPLVQATISNQFEGSIKLTSSFSNNPKYQTGAIWQYSQEISQDEQGYIQISEEGTVIGIGRPLKDKYPAAILFYNSNVSSLALTRISSLYSSYPNTNGQALTNIRNSFSENLYHGEIKYQFVYTDNNTYVSSGMKKLDIDVSITNPVQVVEEFNIINYNQISQPQNQSTQGIVSINAKLRGSRISVLSDYITYITPFIQAYTNYGTDQFLSNCQYSWNPITNSFSIQVEYKFSQSYKTFTDLTLT